MSVESQTETIKLASIVSIDVAGFSSLSERDQRRAARQIEALRSRIESVAGAHGGRIFNTAGDGFMLEFSSAGAALAAIQDLLDKRPKSEPAIRVGAHVGDVIVAVNNDLLGHGVNVAARLQSLAMPGGALVSGEFRSMARTSPSAAFQSRGRQPLENIEQRVHTFEILSRRQRILRLAKRIGLALCVVALAAGAALATPHVIAFARAHGLLREAAQPAAAAEPTAAPTQEAAAPAEPAPAAAPAAPAYSPGQILRDCAFCPELVVLPGGSFVMGSPAGETGRLANEGPAHEVTIAPVAVSKFEILFSEWDA
ncbi:MAG: adenylate/guanylate cyclase domain-containing protein, partial [Hyphomonadaceae bacterium]